MGFIANGIRKISGLKSTEDRSYHSESEDVRDDATAIMLIAAAIAAGLIEIVEDGLVSVFKKK